MRAPLSARLIRYVAVLVVACGTSVADHGGMDGAGSIVPGFRWDTGVYVQLLWEEGQLRYLVINDRREDVTAQAVRVVSVCPAPPESSVGCRKSRDQSSDCTEETTPIEAHWHVPAGATRMFDAPTKQDPATDNGAVHGTGLYALLLEDDTGLGNWGDLPEPPSSFGQRIVGNVSLNGVTPESVQIETDFVTPPAADFSLTLVLMNRGWLILPTQQQRTYPDRDDVSHSIDYLSVLDVRADRGAVMRDDANFRVELPDDASPGSPVLVEVDVEVPPQAIDRPFTVFGGTFSQEGGPVVNFSRAFPRASQP